MSGEATAVSVVAVSRVVPSPAPAEHVKVVLSFLDAPWIATPPVQNVYLYKLASGGDDEYASAVGRIKASLAAALALFVPLAGELKYVPETGDVVVDCSDPAVPFFEAEAAEGSRMDVDRLAVSSDVAHDVEAFVSLVPRHDARVLPAGAAPRRRGPGSRAANSKADYFSQRSQLARRTFFVSADEVRFLEHRIERLASAAGEPKPTVSTFTALVALGWTGMVRAKGLSAGEDAYLTFYADLRARLHPPVGAGYFGNCITGCLAKADAGDLLGEAGLLHA
nr:unnamed protein product [Digitaria exilis]